MTDPHAPVLSVSDVNRYAANLLDKDPLLHNLTVRGEISGFKRHTSGHLYFTLKDDTSSVKCVMFKGQAYSLAFRPADGASVTVNGYISLYQKEGSFQLYVTHMDKSGIGDLFARFMELKASYSAKGYFDESQKKPIPFLPKAIGVVTSGSGAALQDILQIVGRRFPSMPIYLCPVKVQGEGAAEEIAAGIATLDRLNICDVIIVGRGGGSVEDLWAFNEVPVIEAIHACHTPIISAVGHETDFSVSDFVADMRAPTPSAAAELATPLLDSLTQSLDTDLDRLNRAAGYSIAARRAEIELLKGRVSIQSIRGIVSDKRVSLNKLYERMTHAAVLKTVACRAFTDRMFSALSAMNPERVLERGYAIVTNTADKVIASASQTDAGDVLRIRLADGVLETNVIRILPKEK